jgi:membrane protein
MSPQRTPPRPAPGLRAALTTPGALQRARAVAAWWTGTRVARALSRYGARNGGVLASGLALTTLLSLTAALTLAWTVLMAVLGADQELRDAVASTVNAALPGLLRTGSDATGLVDPDSLVRSDIWSLAGVLALAVAAWSAISLVGSLASSIRAMFGVVSLPENGFLTLGRNAVGAAGLAAGLAAGAGAGILMDLLGDWTMDRLGASAGAGRLFIQVGSHLLALAVDAAVLLLLVRVVAGVRVPRPDLAWGLVLFSAAALVLRTLGTAAVGAVKGPLLTTATSLVTLVLWIHLLVRVVLTVSAWMANPPAATPVTRSAAVHFRERPNYVTMTSPHTLDWPHHPVTGELLPELPGPDGGPDQRS